MLPSVVVENILRIRDGGASIQAAIFKGTKQVKGAIISSTLSSIVIFIPILLMQSRESQLFADLAFTISSALMASVLAALVLIPTLAHRFLNKISKTNNDKRDSHWNKKLTVTARNKPLAIVTLCLAIPFALIYSFLAMPDFDVLPNPKQNTVLAFINFNEPMNGQAVCSAHCSTHI